MSYRTILVHVDDSRHAAERIKIAADLAMKDNAHVIGAATTGISDLVYPGGIGTSGIPDIGPVLEVLRQRARRTLGAFENAMQKAGVASFEKRLIADEAGPGISLQARYCDLVVIGQTVPNDPEPAAAADFPEFVVMNSARPVLIVPYAGQFGSVGKKPLIAWDASKAATRAVANALPLLKRAAAVEVAVFNPAEQAGVHGEQPGADIALYLARHGIKVNVTQQTVNMPVGAALLSLASDLNADLIVSGGYGHARFREILLGGVTRTLLESMTVPILMSH